MSMYTKMVKNLVAKAGLTYAEEVFDYLGKTPSIARSACEVLPSKFFPKLPEYAAWQITYNSSKKVASLCSEEEMANILKGTRDEITRSYSQILYGNGQENYRKIAGRSVNEYSVMRPGLASWKDITRGRDMFIPGLGSFDIEAANTQLHARPDWREENWPTVELYTVAQYQAMGYFSSRHPAIASLLSAKKYTKFKAYLIQHKDFWLQPHNAARLDEIVILYKVRPNYELGKKKPQTVLTDAEEAARILASIDKNYKRFNLQNATSYSSAGLTLKVIEDTIELKSVASKLNNCAANYSIAMAQRNCCLVSCTENSVLIALGELRNSGWSQITGQRNSKVDKHVHEAYILFEETIRTDFWPKSNAA